MFNRKRPTKQVTCSECKLLLNVENAQLIFDIFSGLKYYCPKDKRPYDRVEPEVGKNGELRQIYYKEFKVDKEGKLCK